LKQQSITNIGDLNMNRSANILIALLALGATAFAQNTALFWSAFDQGFATSQSSSTLAKSSAGQAIVGSSRQANTLVESGFLANPLLRGIVVGVNE
jgi:hypothetical protein